MTTFKAKSDYPAVTFYFTLNGISLGQAASKYTELEGELVSEFEFDGITYWSVKVLPEKYGAPYLKINSLYWEKQ